MQNSEANLLQLEAKSRKAERDWKRAESLLPNHAIAETDHDTDLSEYEAAKANVASGKAIVRQNKASVKTARINLGYCTIKSPVRGTIIERRVNIGQTVVAALNAPSLFLIAKDLNEDADLGLGQRGPYWTHPAPHARAIHGGRPRERQFRGKVTQIRMNAR